MKALFGQLLPEEVLAREDKAVFNGSYALEPTRDFIKTWDGSGVDTSLIDPGALRAAWSQLRIHSATLPLLHAAWLRAEGLPVELAEREFAEGRSIREIVI
jgi:asparagine synthase (glutamine-hydrolysing)